MIQPLSFVLDEKRIIFQHGGMAFELQNPDDPRTAYLLEVLLGACSQAESGGGAFAFVTPAGVKLLLGDKTFERFKSKNTFDLVVGTDAITTPRSLAALEEASSRLKGLKVRAFLNSRRGSAFHPKFCWFRGARGGTLITGSGNLTRGGLISNWEAFSIEALSMSGARDVEKWWGDWTANAAAQMRPLTDGEVVARAEENARQPTRRLAAAEAPETAEREPEVAAAKPTSDVLIAEIPGTRDSARWKQANFDLETFQRYFGASRDSQRRIFLYHVGADGTLPEDPESRPSVSVPSGNFRFELGAASGLDYPTQGRPIAVFVKVAARTFRYRLLMPNDPAYLTVQRFLASKAPVLPGPNRIRRVQVTAAELQAAWPDSPLWAK